MTPQRRCAWTGKVDSRVIPVAVSSKNAPVRGEAEYTIYVLPEHKQQLLGFLGYALRYRHLFLTLLAAMLLCIVVFDITRYRSLAGVAVLALGPLLWVFPFANQVLFITTSGQLDGVAASIRFIRVLAVAAAALGIAIILF